MTKPLSKPYGDDSDQICSYEMVIYHVPNVKVGSTNDLKTRLKAQKLRPEDVEILFKVPANSSTHNHIWHMEQVNARMLGLPSEHEGNRLAVNRVRTGPLGQSGTYVLTNCETGAITTVSEAGRFERDNKLCRKAIADAANPKNSRKYVPINGVKHTVTYADQKKGGE